MELTRNELSLLLYFETQAVDYGGKLEAARISPDEISIAKRWNDEGFVLFGRLPFKTVKTVSGVTRTHWCVLSNDAWEMAHKERRIRSKRLTDEVTKLRFEQE